MLAVSTKQARKLPALQWATRGMVNLGDVTVTVIRRLYPGHRRSPTPVPTRTSSPYKRPVRAGAKGEADGPGLEPGPGGPKPPGLPLPHPSSRVPGAIRTHTAGVLSAVPPAVGLRGRRAFHQCRADQAVRTKDDRAPARKAWLETQDSNLDERDRLPGQNRVCCQLHQSPVSIQGVEP
jgi:hypothetical protein